MSIKIFCILYISEPSFRPNLPFSRSFRWLQHLQMNYVWGDETQVSAESYRSFGLVSSVIVFWEKVSRPVSTLMFALVPQLEQNFAPSANMLPHFLQHRSFRSIGSSLLPHSRQYNAPFVSSTPHFWHFIRILLSSYLSEKLWCEITADALGADFFPP